MSDEFHLEHFGRHVPNILKRQLIANLAEQFVSQESLPDDYCGSFSNVPSVSHFHGTLLFVDISGFTILSQRLPVDDLRTQINSYFKKIIDIVDEYGGDVIKFAGDALFIVWQTTQSEDEETFLTNIRQAGLRALRCGVDIIAKCSNYPVPLTKAKASPASHTELTTVSETDAISKIVLETRNAPPTLNSTSQVEYTYLNVHAGLSIGRMTGIDIGALDRWEFFIIGQPLHDVAEAEASAEKGELVLTAVAHDLLCCAAIPPSAGDTETLIKENEEVQPCGCVKNAGGCFRIATHRVPHFDKVLDPDEEDDLDRELHFYEDVMRHSLEAFTFVKDEVIAKVRAYRDKFAQDLSISAKLLYSAHHSNGEQAETTQGSAKLLLTNQNIELTVREEESLHNFFMRWISDCLKNDFARHVHEADRIQFAFRRVKRTDIVQQYFDDQLALNRRRSDPSVPAASERGSIDMSFQRSRHNTQTTASSGTSPSSSASASTSSSGSSNFVSKIRSLAQKQSLRDRSRAKHERTLRIDSGLNGELRNVIVLFIAIHGEPDMAQPIPHRPNLPNKFTFTAPKCFNFAQSYCIASEGDAKLLAHYLACIDVIVRSLKDQGGQLRQFIVDDKGTVSIGTFGLRGSTNVDNAAAAIEAAMHVVHGLQNLGLNASVGITAGPAYCGIVGSLRRHEYAVMGPSVNLSARLMGKAKRGEILCDASIRRQDRSHHFHHVGEVQAKGFAEPVPIYKPSSTRASIMMDASLLPSMLDVTTPSAANLTGMTPHTTRLYSDGGGEHTRGQSSKLEVRDMHLYGRDEEIERAYSVIFDAMRKNSDGKSSLPDVESTTPAHHAIDGARFDNTRECVGASLNGSSGIGKSAILEYFFHIAKDLRSLHGCNVAPFYDISSSLDGREPYKGWKTVFRHIFARMSRFRDVQVPEQSNEKEHEKLRDKWFRGATRLVRDLPASVQEALPLLSAAHIIPGIPETPEIAALSGAVKLKKLGELLEALMLEFPRVTGDLMVVLLDDVHLADAFSLRLFMSILRHGKGINFLMTWNVDMEKAMPEEQQLIIKENEEIYQEFVKSGKLVEIDLNPLSFDSLKAMTTGVLLRDNIIVRNDAIFQRLEDITGGNPLYAYELAKAVVDKYKATDHHGTNDGDDVMLEIIDSFKAHRVEEVIFYRMDRLESKTQMLLKMASVACASGTSKGFSLEMIATMLKGNYEAFGGDFLDSVVDVFFEAEETKRIMKTLSVLVKSLIDAGEFLKIVHGRNRGSFSSSEKSIDIRPPTIDDLMALEPDALSTENAEDKIFEEYKDMFFDFKIGLERNMIYELMLEEQKESLHDRVATFLEKNNAVREHRMMLSSNDLLEEAFHWERAKVWTNALTCYYRAATILEGLGAFQGSYRYYASGFRCFTSLQKVMGENLLSWVNCDDPVRLISLMMRVPHQGLETLVTVEECAEYVQYRHAIYRVVSGDEALLLTIVKTITKFAQGAGTLDTDPQVTLTLYHEALVIIFFTWKHRYLQDLYSGRLQEVVAATAVTQATSANSRSGMSKVASRKQSTGEESEEASEENKKSSSSLTSPITAAALHAHEPAVPGNNRSTAAEPHHTNSMMSTRSSASWNTQIEKADMAQFGLADIQTVFPILSGMAALYRMRRVPDDDRRSKESQFYDAMVLFASLSSENHEHQLQAMALLYQLAIETENYTEADSLVERIRETYNHAKYSPRLVEVYGNDRIPFTIALHAQSLILLGKLPSALQLMEEMMALLPQMEHLHSMGILAITLSTGLIVVGRVEEACRVFHHYYSYEQSKPIEVFSFFREVNPLLATWHNLHMQTLDNAAREKQAIEAVSEQLLHHQSNMTGQKPLCLVESEEIIEKVVQKGFYFSGETKRPLLYDALMSFGSAVEYVSAEILSMIALSRTKYLFEQLLPSSNTTVDDAATRAQCEHLLKDIPQTMQIALDYIALGIEQTRTTNKLKFPFLLSVLAKVKIMLQVDAFHDRCRDFVNDHATHWATALIMEHVPALTPEEEMAWSKTICVTLSDIEEKGRQYQMPFISFASVLLADVIFGGGSCANAQAAFTAMAAGGADGDSSTTVVIDPTATVSGKTRGADMGSDAVGLTSKVAEAAMQLSGVDMTMVKVLEESLPHFWCGNFNRRFKARPPMDADAVATEAITTATAATVGSTTETTQ